MTTYRTSNTSRSTTYTPSRRSNFLLKSIVVFLLLFNLFSFSSSREALIGLWGVVSWSNLLAFSLCAVDFAGLAKMYIPEDDRPKDAYAFLFGAWILSAIGDTFLTYLAVANQMSKTADSVLLLNEIISLQAWTMYIPVAFAVLVWAIQVLLVTRLSYAVDKG